jgi:uncharacterized Rmd1/YagE family protein
MMESAQKLLKKGTAYCLAQSFDITALAKHLSGANLIRIIKDTLLIEDDFSWSVIFSYGAVVHWNVDNDKQATLDALLIEHATNIHHTPETEHFTFSLNCPTTRIYKDSIEIEADDPVTIFALSHGMGQSIKLASFETHAILTINNTRYIPQSLAENGSIKLNSRNIAKIRGQLFLTKSDIFLNYDLLDTPDFFWEYPEYENFYLITAKYLEIAQRTEVLSKKLETIQELFDVLADEQKHRHSLMLEWIVIGLITFEASMAIVDKFL